MKKQFIIIISLAIIMVGLNLVGKTYARYVLTRNFNADISSAPFYFDVSNSNNNVVFPRTESKTDFDTILTTKTKFSFVLKNNNGSNFNSFDTTYQVSVVNSSKFSLDGGVVTKTIKGGSKLDETVELTLDIDDLTRTDDSFRLQITSTEPYVKTVYLDFTVTQDGAIQYIDDLVILTLKMREEGYTSSVAAERFKMTRDLDFKDLSSYKDPYTYLYENINMDSVTGNLFEEMTASGTAGFLPIGELAHPFTGAFNGGGHTLANLYIHKALQINIGLFGTTVNATIKNFTVKGGDVRNSNQTAGMIIGKMQGGLLDGVIVDGTSVMSTDISHTNQDTYTGGLVGFAELKATISNCTNRAHVETNFTGVDTEYSGPAGGIVAWMANSTVTNCLNYGTVVGQSYVGGIVGFAAMQDATAPSGGGTVSNCHNYGAVSSYVTSTAHGGKHIGGIAGYNKAAGHITGCTNHAEASVRGLQYVGGIVGSNYGSISGNTNSSSEIYTNSTKNVKVCGLAASGSLGC